MNDRLENLKKLLNKPLRPQKLLMTEESFKDFIGIDWTDGNASDVPPASRIRNAVSAQDFDLRIQRHVVMSYDYQRAKITLE